MGNECGLVKHTHKRSSFRERIHLRLLIFHKSGKLVASTRERSYAEYLSQLLATETTKFHYFKVPISISSIKIEGKCSNFQCVGFISAKSWKLFHFILDKQKQTLDNSFYR
jgi:hypothetical protein